MNIIIEGIDGVGKTTLANKLMSKYHMVDIIHSTARTRNDLTYHLDLLDYHNSAVFDRFHFGEACVFPKLYGRECKLTMDEFKVINKRIVDNNDMLILMICSDLGMIDERLKARGELEYIEEIRQQLPLFVEAGDLFKKQYPNYKNFYVCDVSKPNAYNDLDEWIDEHYGKKTINIAYRQICKDIVEKGHAISSRNLRGGTLELCNYMFTIEDIDASQAVTLKSGRAVLSYIAAETLWYWSGRNDLEFISKFSNIWPKVSDDGITSNSAYGYIMKYKHGFNQIEKIIELLTVDPTSRRAVINLNIPNENVIETRDEICTICLMYTIRDGKLHCTNIMRANDVRYGTLNDLFFMLNLQKYIAKRLNVPTGTYTHFANSMHAYDRDYKFIKDIAYGTLESVNENIDFDLLLEHQDELIDYIDNHFESRQAFQNLLDEKGIIRHEEEI